MQERSGKICATVLQRITPNKRERALMAALAQKLEERVASVSKEFSVEAEVRLEGSIAKDTWLSKELDIDIFMRLPITLPRKSFGAICLEIARKATEGSKQVERFAEHPYLEAIVDDTRVNIVPCYNVERGEWLSATDRTPFHTDYVKRHLKKQMKDEVRLLKKLMKGIGVYGAEIKVGGFSGYLCELLILHYKSFLSTVRAFAKHKKRITIDIENYYSDRANKLILQFKEPLVVIDPVDRRRNVASAVQPQRLHTFTAAAQAFLKSPNIEFFYPPETVALSEKKLKQELTKRGSVIIFVTFGKVDAVPDVLWGQLYKSQRSLNKLIQLNGFKTLRGLPWSDEKTISMLTFMLEQRFISRVKKHQGPPLQKESECEKFLQKYVDSPITASGPYIEDGRWVVEIIRKYTDVATLLEDKLKSGGRDVGVAERISRKLRSRFKVFINDEIVRVYKRNSEFALFLTEFLSGKPRWLENGQQN